MGGTHTESVRSLDYACGTVVESQNRSRRAKRLADISVVFCAFQLVWHAELSNIYRHNSNRSSFILWVGFVGLSLPLWISIGQAIASLRVGPFRLRLWTAVLALTIDGLYLASVCTGILIR